MNNIEPFEIGEILRRRRKVLGYTRAIFVGKSSLGYIPGQQYSLAFYRPSFWERVFDGWDFIIVDQHDNAFPCPYRSVVDFLVNWETGMYPIDQV